MISVYILGFIFGLIEIIILLIKGLSFSYDFNVFHIIDIIALIGNYYLFYFIIYKLSPTHSIIIQSICRLLYYILYIILEKTIIQYNLYYFRFNLFRNN